MDEAELLFTEILDCDRQGLYLNQAVILERVQGRVIGNTLRRRMKGEPLQYILGRTEFMGLEFRVREGVFIPRPETEILVETAVKVVSNCLDCAGDVLGHCSGFVRRENEQGRTNAGDTEPFDSLDLSSALLRTNVESAEAGLLGPFRGSQVRKLRILDLGTGSGCIAVSLAKLFPDIEVTATDISLAALEAARDNARLNNVTINFIPGDLFDACGPQPAVYDMILCNPPYIASAEINGLQPEISYEPKLALDGGSDGLDFYRRIIRASRDYLGQGSFLIMEMGFNQYPRIKEIFRDSGKFDIIKAVRDYNDIDRVVLARYV